MKPLYPMPDSWSVKPPDRDAIQAWVLDGIGKARAAGRKSVLVQAPMGVGKTICAVKLARSIQERGEVAIFLCHLKTLVDQTARAFRDWGVDFQIEQGTRKARKPFGPAPSHVIALVNSLNPRRMEDFLGRTGFGSRPVVAIVDECHLCATPKFLKPLETLRPALTVGLTGTPMRYDGKPLVGPGAPFEALCCRYDFLTACRHGVLVPPTFRECEGAIDLRGVTLTRQKHGTDYDPGELTARINEQLHHICNAARMEMEDYGLKRCLFFAPDVGVANAVERWFTSGDVGIPCRAVYGELADREAVLRSYRNGDLRVLVSVEMLNVGFDDPPTDGIIMARPTKSPVMAIQQAGRGSRLHDGKTRYVCIGFRWEDGDDGPQSTLDLLLRGIPDEGTRAIAHRLLRDRPRLNFLEAVEEAEIERRKELEEERRRRRQLPVVGIQADVPYVGRTYNPMSEPSGGLDPAIVKIVVELGKDYSEAAAMTSVAAIKFIDFWESRRRDRKASYKQVNRLMHGVARSHRMSYRDAMELTNKEAQSMIWKLRQQGLCHG